MSQFIIKSIVEGMEICFRYFSQNHEIICHKGDVEWIIPKTSCSGPSIIYKASLQKQNVEDTIDKIIIGIEEGSIPAWWVINPESTPDNLKETLLMKGFVCLGDDEPGMALCFDNELKYLECPNNIQVSKVQWLEEFTVWVNTVNKALHGWDLLSTDKYSSWLGESNLVFYLAYFEGKPVATSATIKSRNIGSIEFVSTLPEYRNRGIGTAVSVAAICGLRNEGVNLVTLRSCNEAINMYKKLGFQSYYNQTIMKYERN